MESKFKIGDKLRCIKPDISRHEAEVDQGGAGWKEGKTGTVCEITGKGFNTVYWFTEFSDGAFEEWLELETPQVPIPEYESVAEWDNIISKPKNET